LCISTVLQLLIIGCDCSGIVEKCDKLLLKLGRGENELFNSTLSLLTACLRRDIPVSIDALNVVEKSVCVNERSATCSEFVFCMLYHSIVPWSLLQEFCRASIQHPNKTFNSIICSHLSFNTYPYCLAFVASFISPLMLRVESFNTVFDNIVIF